MEEVQTYPPEPFDHKRPDFEAAIKQVAIDRFEYSKGDALLKSLTYRNRSGRYQVDWVKGAWEGYNMPQPTAGINEQAITSSPDSSVTTAIAKDTTVHLVGCPALTGNPRCTCPAPRVL